MRAEQVVTQRRRADTAEEFIGIQRVVQRLGHLLPVDRDEAVVYPVLGELVACCGGLGKLVLMVRESQVEAASVDVERTSEVVLGHR